MMLPILCLLVGYVSAQARGSGSFALPTAQMNAPKPVIADDLAKYFQLAPGQKTLVDIFDTGVVPKANFETASEHFRKQQQLQVQQEQQQRLLQGGAFGFAPGTNSASNSNYSPFGTLPAGVDQQAVANAFGQALGNGNDEPHQPAGGSVQTLKVPTDSTSSIRGIPNVQMNLPKPPNPNAIQRPAPLQRSSTNQLQLPTIPDRPQVPQGGLGPLTASSLDSEPKSDVFQPQFPAGNNVFDTQVQQFSQEPQQPAGGLIGAMMEMLRKGSVAAGAAQTNLTAEQQKMLDEEPKTPKEAIEQYGKQQSQMIETFRTALRNNAGTGQGGLLSNVLYNALTAGSLVKTDNTTDPDEIKNKTTEAITENIGLIQQILTQNDSPLCYPRPRPVQSFDVDAFMGTWYQVLYSPPVSVGPCSMISYNKLADVASGGPGTVFDTFEYTTEATAFGSPKIASGYAIVRAPGELIYRTSASDHDVSVNVVGTGPVNALGQYEWTLLVINCNYPVHVFARDPAVYKQKYESQVNSLLDQTKITNGFSRLLNLVAPVDTTLCTFPPTLFNIQG